MSGVILWKNVKLEKLIPKVKFGFVRLISGVMEDLSIQRIVKYFVFGPILKITFSVRDFFNPSFFIKNYMNANAF